MTHSAHAQADLLIVGAGILGVFHAHFAAASGRTVLLIDRNGSPSEASVRNFGMLSQTVVEVGGAWAGYASDSAAIYSAIQAECDISLRRRGSLYLAQTEIERTVLLEFSRLPQAGRPPCEFIEPNVLRAEHPYVQEATCTGALFFPEDYGADPRRLLPSILKHVVRDSHIQYLPGTTITAVNRCGDGCSARTAAGDTLFAGQIVLCTGAEWELLFPDHFRTSGVQLCKLQMMRTVSHDDVALPHNLLSGLSIRRYPAFKSCTSYGALMAERVPEAIHRYGIHVLIKAERDDSVTIGDSHEYRDLGDTADLRDRSAPAIDAAILRYARSMVTLPTWDICARWNGYYLVHPTHPVFSVTVDTGIHVRTGIGGKGLTTGPGFSRHSIATLLACRSALSIRA